MEQPNSQHMTVAIEETDPPVPFKLEGTALVTRAIIVDGLRRAGIAPGDTVLVHSALSELGFVVGAGLTVIEALLETVGPDGTIMMPTFSGDLSDPAEWKYPAVPTDWIETIRDQMPPFDKRLTPTRKMGVVPELFRNYPGVVRSDHPQSSFAAWGKKAAFLTENHAPDDRFGPASPLGKLVESSGKVLLLGAPAQTCSFFYLTAHHMDGVPREQKSSPVLVDGRKQWRTYHDLVYTNHWFNAVTNHLLDQGLVAQFTIGDASCLLFSAQGVLDPIVAWRTRKSEI